jgi:predicted  nucleic acid-binding Zn-ribbon protein
MEKAEYEEIEGQENKEVRIQRLQNEIELFNDRQSEVESRINHLMPQRETNPDVQSEIEELKVKIGIIQQEREDMERELGRLLEHQ